MGALRGLMVSSPSVMVSSPSVMVSSRFCRRPLVAAYVYVSDSRSLFPLY